MRWNPRYADVMFKRRSLPHKVRINVPFKSYRACMTSFNSAFQHGDGAAAIVVYNGVAHRRVDFLFATPELLQRFRDVVEPFIKSEGV